MARIKKEKKPLLPEYQAFIKMLARERMDKKIDQKVLANLLGITEGTYSRKENGITPITLSEAFLLCRFFNEQKSMQDAKIAEQDAKIENLTHIIQRLEKELDFGVSACQESDKYSYKSGKIIPLIKKRG